MVIKQYFFPWYENLSQKQTTQLTELQNSLFSNKTLIIEYVQC